MIQNVQQETNIGREPIPFNFKFGCYKDNVLRQINKLVDLSMCTKN